ncbi:IclR family transcriptional regulator [Nocardia aurantiaca]|uniref:Glycerol operon regulatory protein n=1 Tax=Nocardia aurantiaca TaxID=2675850 RepID=A0A6I3L0C7_9NOCA|nr:helix-turn-helix domain-containing protein [Nocardia aurantiaca]MTE16433.1 helix-turn-helix domain-containing protein [Nocardia aurantiaca]
MTDEPRSGARAVDRAIGVLNCFQGDDPELTLSELAQRAGLPVSTAHRLTQALVRGGLLEQSPASDRYRVGHGLAALARPALARLGLESAAPHLYALAAGIRITVSVSVMDDRDAVTVFQARPPVHFCHHQVPRPRQSLHASAAGHALLAYSPARRAAADDDLDRVRRTGFASELIETDDPIRSLAVPIVGLGRQVHGALAVQARSARLNSELVRAVVPAMRIAAGRIAPLLQTTDGAAFSAAEFRSR